MCGISGFTGPAVPGVMDRMLQKLEHRGPDDQGIYETGGMRMGIRRLSIIDVKGGHQPISSEDGSVWIVFNGEIYNYVELRAELEAKGYRFKTASDTETILKCYQAYGEQGFYKLNGMFAAALWEPKEGRLRLVRDRYGEKPLFYAQAGKDLVFGSEIKAVLCHPSVDRDLDEEALSHYFSLRNIPAPFTVYRGVRALPPGHQLIWQNGSAKIQRWYELPTLPGNETREEVLMDQIESLLQDSIRIRLRAEVKTGAYLSGGIDSSLVVALMSKMSPQKISTFSLSYADSPAGKQDSFFAKKVAEQLNTAHHEYSMSWTELRDEINDVIEQLDQPFAGVTSSFWLSRFIKKHVTVALSGDGADDVFGSYGHHRLVWPLDALQRGESSVDYGFFEDRKEWVRKMAEMKPWEWRLAYAAFTENEKSAVFSKKGKELFGGTSTAGFLKNIYERSDSRADALNKMLYLDIQTLLPNEVLYYSDMLSMAHSVEVRAPFLDYRLVELGCRIPGHLKIKGRTLKYILRKVAARYLPKEVLERPKEGFVLPNHVWLRNGLAPWMEALLAPDRMAAHGYFDPAEVRKLIDAFKAGNDALTFKLWTLLNFQLWYEKVYLLAI